MLLFLHLSGMLLFYLTYRSVHSVRPDNAKKVVMTMLKKSRSANKADCTHDKRKWHFKICVLRQTQRRS